MAKRHLYIVLTLLLFAACDTNSPTEDEVIDIPAIDEALVLVTDSSEWHVALFHERLYYNEAVQQPIPSPYRLPTRDEAKVLHDLVFGSGQYRYITSDGYTFGMPSASVSKAGSKTHYSVLGLHIKYTQINIEW